MSPAAAALETQSAEGFLLTRSSRDTPTGLTLELWLACSGGPVRVIVTQQRAVFFVLRSQADVAGSRREVALTTLGGAPVDAVYFTRQADLRAERHRLETLGCPVFEGDIKPAERFLMERFVTGGARVTGPCQLVRGIRTFTNPKLASIETKPALRTLSIDIETDGFEGDLLSIAAVSDNSSWCAMMGVGPARPGLMYFEQPEALLQAFFGHVQDRDPDVLIGWNLIDFDLRYLQELCNRLSLKFDLGRNGYPAKVLSPGTRGQPYVALLPGRVALDGITALRNASFALESFALQDVAQRFVGRGKALDAGGDALAEIRRLYREDKPALARYNEEDCRLVLDVFDRIRLLDLSIERQKLTGLPLDRPGGSVAAFDQLYLPRLHRRGRVAPSVGGHVGAEGSPGGTVLESQPGLYHDVLVLDFKSLYPSIIRTFRVDPYGLAIAGDDAIEGYGGGRFARKGHILPALIERLSSAREAAKRDGNAALSQAIKILMNSVYGVLGTPGCRFFDPRLPTSITRRGHEILTRSRDVIEAQGLRVIYGDTDSLFVHLEGQPSEISSRARGSALARQLNAYWQATLRDELSIESHLEIEFETHYLRFLMPTMRGSERGTKKRYAGLQRGSDGKTAVVFKGLEAVRTDWTLAAREFQRELFRRVFCDEPYVDYVRQTAQRVMSGELNTQLVYRKRLRRELSEYTRNVPPHVQAARKLSKPTRHIDYVITLNGPEPAQNQTAPLDYEHYLERQLAPAADSLLHLLGTDFYSLAGPQQSLF